MSYIPSDTIMARTAVTRDVVGVSDGVVVEESRNMEESICEPQLWPMR